METIEYIIMATHPQNCTYAKRVTISDADEEFKDFNDIYDYVEYVIQTEIDRLRQRGYSAIALTSQEHDNVLKQLKYNAKKQIVQEGQHR